MFTRQGYRGLRFQDDSFNHVNKRLLAPISEGLLTPTVLLDLTALLAQEVASPDEGIQRNLQNLLRLRLIQVSNILLRFVADIRRFPFMFIVNFIAASILVPRSLRTGLWLLAGIKTNTDNLYPLTYVRSRNLTIGRGTVINSGCHFENATASVTIGLRCGVGPRVMFIADSHEVGPEAARTGTPLGMPVVVEDGCWIGAGVVILPGVTIASGCVIGAGAVVGTSTKPNGLYAGSPARRVRDLP